MKPYGGIAREDRIGDGPYCDKAWHLSHEPVLATRVLTCADCGKRFARCAQCNRGGDTVEISMRAHRYARHSQSPLRRLVPHD